MTDEQTLALVRTNAVALNFALDDAQARRVAVHLQRTAAIAAALDNCPLAPHDEPAELFHPAPFVSSGH